MYASIITYDKHSSRHWEYNISDLILYLTFKWERQSINKIRLCSLPYGGSLGSVLQGGLSEEVSVAL